MLSSSAATGLPQAQQEGDPAGQRFDSTAVWLILVAGTVLRLIGLGYKSYWIDEIASVAIAQRPSAAFWRFLWHDEGNMALYYIALRPWLRLGGHEGTVRLLSVLPGVVSIPVMYLLARRLFGRNVALVA